MTTLREAAQQAIEALEGVHKGEHLGGVDEAIEALRQALEQPENKLSDRDVLIAKLRDDSARHADSDRRLCNKAADMIEADAQEIARSQGQEITKNDAKRDTLRTRLNIIMGQINQLEWKTGVGGSYFETVQEQCDAIVKDFGLKKLSSHLMSLPHTWVRRNTGLTDGYEIIEPRGRYVPANQPQTSGPAQQVAVPPTHPQLAQGAFIPQATGFRAAPQPAAYVPLTDYEIKEMAVQEQILLFCDGIEELTAVVRAVEARMTQRGKT